MSVVNTHTLCVGMNGTMFQEFPFLGLKKGEILFRFFFSNGIEWACGESLSCSIGRSLISPPLFLVALLGERSRCQELMASDLCASLRCTRAMGAELLPISVQQIASSHPLPTSGRKSFQSRWKTKPHFARPGRLLVNCDKTQEMSDCWQLVRGERTDRKWLVSLAHA